MLTENSEYLQHFYSVYQDLREKGYNVDRASEKTINIANHTGGYTLNNYNETQFIYKGDCLLDLMTGSIYREV